MTALYVPPTEESDHKKQNQSLQLIGGVVSTNTTNITTNTTNIATNTASIAAHEAAWTAFTPGISAAVGTLTTTSTTGRYKLLGKTVFVEMSLTITTNGTGSSTLITTLPVASVSNAVIAGRETAINGKALTGTVNASATSMNVCFYDNTYAGANGSVLVLTGVYETT